MMNPRVVRVGTRGSALALAQTALAIAALVAVDPDTRYETTIIRTEGDRDKVTPLTVIGGQGVFTVALQDALLRGETDIAVHSAKDLPPGTPDGLVLAAFPERADARDVFISRHNAKLTELPPGSRVGTSSRRRAVQALAINPAIEIVELRGNLDTRLRKSTEPEYDGIIVAAAGLDRMGWQERITEYLPAWQFVPSPGQGALGIECRADDTAIGALLARIDHAPTRAAVTAERAALTELGAGCRMPFAAYAVVDDAAFLEEMYGMLADEDGTNLRRLKIETNEGHNPMPDPVAAGRMLAEQLQRGPGRAGAQAVRAS
jgi:hydroxymethylbilane synthase